MTALQPATRTRQVDAAELTAHVVTDLSWDTTWEREYDSWARFLGMPVTASSRWVFAEIDTGTSRPWLVVARDSVGELHGMLVLLDDTMNGQTVTTLAGCDQGHRGHLAVDSPEVGARLGKAIARELRSRDEPCRLLLGPLDSRDELVHALAASLPGAALIPEAPIPVIRKDSTHWRDYLSHNMARTVRKGRNRLETDGCELTVSYTSDPSEIAMLLPLLEQVHRDRDHAHGRPSDLDDTHAARVWRQRLERLSRVGQVELAVLTIDGEFAAHAIAAVDGEAYRILEGRFVTRFSRYAPGRILEAAVLQRVLDDEHFTTLDWMTAVAPEKLLATNAADPMSVLHWVPGL